MNRRRHTHRGLALTRIYARGRRFYLFAREAIENPRTGKIAKWHGLCAVDEGEDKARELAREIIRHNSAGDAEGDMPEHVEAYRLAMLRRRERGRPRDAARLAMFADGNKELTRICRAIADAFSEFDVAQVMPVDVAGFVDQWEGRRAAQVYRARLSDFFAWACRKGLRHDNPVREVSVEKPPKRTRYITHAEYHAARDALALGKDGRPTPSGPMMQAALDLMYLTMQRPTEIRLLRWSEVGADAITFKPTKTEGSTGRAVTIPITPAIRGALARAKQAAAISSMYVICTAEGQPYTANGLGTAWARACARAGVSGATLKDIRPKALTDAKRAGYSIGQLAVAAAHADTGTTEGYIKDREAERSEVALQIPAREN